MYRPTTELLGRELCRTEHARELDRLLAEQGVSGSELMERAGKAAWEKLKQLWPETKVIALICGGGNNAGDGYVLATCALLANCRVKVYALVTPDNLAGDARSASQNYLAAGGEIDTELLDNSLEGIDVIVDALFGIGLSRPVVAPLSNAIQLMNASRLPILSLDVPSGLSADTGQPLGKEAVVATATLTFIAVKCGLLTGQSADYTGTLFFDDLNVADYLHKQGLYDRVVQTPVSHIWLECYSELLTPRRRTAHKGDFGHVLVIGGDYGFAGAPLMAAMAAARVGAGKISVATRSNHAAALSVARPELMVHGVDTGADLQILLNHVNVVAMGTGLGQSGWAQELLACVLDWSGLVVLDADGLKLLSAEPIRKNNWILTPHPGEAACLLGNTTRDIQQNRFQAVAELQNTYGGVAVLKGSGTLICNPQRHISLCSEGTPGLASGGTGDVLTGIIAGCLAQGYGLTQATELGVCLHSRAALCEAQSGERGMLATDILDQLRLLVNP